MVRALVLGLELYYVVPSSSPLENTSKKFDFSAMVPMQLKNDLGKIEMIDKLLVGGAPLSESLRKEVRIMNNTIYETFGMTETMSHIAMRKLSGGINEESFKTLDNISISIDPRDCLVVRAPELGIGEVITNDVVALDGASGFKWLGRFDNVINSGGVKLHPEIIEEKLEAVVGRRFFIAGIPDEALGEKMVVIVEGKLNTDRLFARFQDLKNLNKFEIPRAVLALPEFELTRSGKINRKETIKRITG